jgi:endonuclease YncB( thermonuclease family)
MKKILLSLTALVALAGTAQAHSGGLNSSGCHNQRGGTYHCHHGSPATSAKKATSAKAVTASKAKRELGTVSGLVTVVDGDTIKFGHRSIRLHGIDAPEKKQPCHRSGKAWSCGMSAKNALTAMVAGRSVSCTVAEIDKYGRGIGKCEAAGVSLNSGMVNAGWAMAYVKYSTDYVSAEASAKASGVGIWSSTFDPPWVWRRR